MGKSTITDQHPVPQPHAVEVLPAVVADSPNVVSEMEDLNFNRPKLSDSDMVIAAWYRRKATMLEHVGRPDLAASATAHADLLDHNSGQVAA